MCSDELESTKQGGKTDVQQSSMQTPPWTPQYDQSYSPAKVEGATAETQPPVKETKDKENLPNNMQDDGKMTFKEYKQKQNGTTTKGEHFKNLILSTDSDVTSCGKLVVDRVIESIYSQEFGKIEPKPDPRPKTTTVSATYTPQQHNQNGIKPSDRLSGLFGSSHSNQQQNQTQMVGAVKTEPPTETKDGGGKMTLTFGQIQETLIRKAVENSHDFDIASGLKSENIAYLYDSKEKMKERQRADYSVFDFPSSDVGQNLVEMSSFESRIKSKKFDSSKSAFSTGSGIIINQPKPFYTQTSVPSPFSQSSTNNKLSPSSYVNGTSQVTSSYSSTMPPKGSVQYMNRTAMELLQKCDELSRNNASKTKQNVQSPKPPTSDRRLTGNSSLTNQQQTNASPVAAQKSPPVPLKKRKFHLPIEPTSVEEKPVAPVTVNKR